MKVITFRAFVCLVILASSNGKLCDQTIFEENIEVLENLQTETTYLKCRNPNERISLTGQRMVRVNPVNSTGSAARVYLPMSGQKDVSEIRCEAKTLHADDFVRITTENEPIVRADVYVLSNPEKILYSVWFDTNLLTPVMAEYIIDVKDETGRPDCWAEKFCLLPQYESDCKEYGNLHHLNPPMGERYGTNKYQIPLLKKMGAPNIIKTGFGFDKGHLVPNADFSTMDKRKATFYYFNTVPMYWSINRNGNWVVIEKYIRDNRPFENRVIVGAKGILSWGNQDIYLDLDEHKYVPIPLYVWKKVQWTSRANASQRVLVTFVVVHYPFSEGHPTDADVLANFSECAGTLDEYCTNLSQYVIHTYVNINADVNGVTYCCYELVV